MTQPAGNIPPVLHPSVLETLLWELDEDEGVWAIFIRNYINLLPYRIERVRMTLTTADLTGATDAGSPQECETFSACRSGASSRRNTSAMTVRRLLSTDR